MEITLSIDWNLSVTLVALGFLWFLGTSVKAGAITNKAKIKALAAHNVPLKDPNKEGKPND